MCKKMSECKFVLHTNVRIGNFSLWFQSDVVEGNVFIQFEAGTTPS